MRSLNPGRAGWLRLLEALAVSACVAGVANAAAPRIDEGELSAVGFKVLDKVMREATARDLSDPFLGVGWADLGG